MPSENQGDDRKRITEDMSKGIKDDVKTGMSESRPGKINKKPVYCIGSIRHKGDMNLI
ncbi:hypothetical protein [Candidatus Uabimicrobium sp. HlEnr_7]|uniref:hypothetical protein n=1 Tax=Candidatus Uabimicrobium helgolandensis TaxID=3095367 RepID=UPI00355914A1